MSVEASYLMNPPNYEYFSLPLDLYPFYVPPPYAALDGLLHETPWNAETALVLGEMM